MRRYRRLGGSVLIGIGLLTTIPASADPAQDQLARYTALTQQAEQLNENYLAAKEDLNTKQTQLDQINANLQVAIQNQTTEQAQTDAFVTQTFISGGPVSNLSALLDSKSQSDMLQASSLLGYIAEEKKQTLNSLEQAKDHVADLQKDAQKAKDDASKLVSDIESRKRDLDKQISDVQIARSSLSVQQKTELKSTGAPIPNVTAPSSAAQVAVNAALSKLGSPYVWGATGPSTFDCSGLTQWAYKQAGISIPRVSLAQSQFGQLVPASQLQPGDLVFFYVPVSHVGMYIGNGMMVHAPTTGDVVKISKVQTPLIVARRVT